MFEVAFIAIYVIASVIIYSLPIFLINLISNKKNNTSKNAKKSKHDQIRDLVCVAMFCAIAALVSAFFPIKVQFLTFDAKDAIITIGGMFFGPYAALSMSLIVPFIEFLTLSDTGIYGLIMNFLSSAAFSVTASLVYKYRRKMSGAVIGLSSAVIAMVSVMMVANVFITPFYMGVSRDMVIGLIPTLLLPFNATKSVLNAALVLLLYKPFITALRATNIVPRSESGKKSSPIYTLITASVAVVLLIVAFIVYFTVLGGSFSFFGSN